MVCLNKKRFNFLKKYKAKEEHRKITYSIIEAETGVTKDNLDDYFRTTDGKQHPISLSSLKKLGKFFDAHPDYLSGELNIKAIDIDPDLYGLSEEEYIKIRPVPHEIYLELKSENLIDDDGYYVPLYDTYGFEQQHKINEQHFIRWLKSINLFTNSAVLRSWPSNSILENLLSRMSEEEIEYFQSDLIYHAIDFLISNYGVTDFGRFKAPYAFQYTEAEIMRMEPSFKKQFLKKEKERDELYRSIEDSSKEGDQ